MKKLTTITVLVSALLMASSANALVSDVFDMMWKYKTVQAQKELKEKKAGDSIQSIVLAYKACKMAVSKDQRNFEEKASKTLPQLDTNEKRLEYALITVNAQTSYEARRLACGEAAKKKLQNLKDGKK